MTQQKFDTTRFARQKNDVAIQARIARLESELTFTQGELAYANSVITGLVNDVANGKSVKIKDEFGYSAVVVSAGSVKEETDDK